MQRHPELRAAFAVILVLAALAGAIYLAVRPSSNPSARIPPASWQGLVGDAHPSVSTEQRSIVVLKTPSVAERLAQKHYATEDDERRWSAQAYAVQQQVLALLASRGLGVRPDFSYSRVLNGFSAVLDSRAIAMLNALPEVEGVYPVRAAFPASISAQSLAQAQALIPGVTLPGFDGSGLTIALLDTGVDRKQPYLGGRVEAGLDLVNGTSVANARTSPEQPAAIERHGTQMAGLLVGSGGPDGLQGVAPGATVFPIRVAGWQPDSEGRSVIYARTDQLIAGLDRAVDPDGDGDAHDAARIALIGVAEPFAAFADSAESRAVDGALALDMLVVAPAGNDGSAGPLYGSIAGPAAAAGAITVGATDERPTTSTVHVVMRRGLDVVLDDELPLLAAATRPNSAKELAVVLPRGDGTAAADWFDRRGLSLAAGGAALVGPGHDPGAAALAASRAGAAAVLVYGKSLPSGSLGISNEVTIPVVAVPARAVRTLLEARRLGYSIAVAVGKVHSEPNNRVNRVAPFSSRGLTFGATVKPDLTAPGTALGTSDPGLTPDGSPAFASVNGTSAAAASVAGTAALLAEARPGLGAADLRSLLVGYARPAPGAETTTAGAGEVDVGAAASAEVVASTPALSFGVWQEKARATQSFTVRNVSTRRIVVRVTAPGEYGTLALRVKPAKPFVLSVGQQRRVTVTATGAPPTGERVSAGAIAVTTGSRALRIPWAIAFPPGHNLLPRVSINPGEFRPSDYDPAVLRVRAGAVDVAGGVQIVPVSRLDVLLYSGDGKFVGALARLRDLLPGVYSFGITGRGPSGVRLEPGAYQLRVVAWPVDQGKLSRARVSFRIEGVG